MVLNDKEVNLEALLSPWEQVVYLASNGKGIDWLALSNGVHSIEGSDLNKLDQKLREWKGEWVFGYLGYDLKNQLEQLKSRNADGIGFEDYLFFVPDLLLKIEHGHIEVVKGEIPDRLHQTLKEIPKNKVNGPHWRCTKQNYLRCVETIQELLQAGEFYEMNFCHEFYFDQAEINPVQLYHELATRTNAPFGGMVKHGSRYALCGSPERFLRKQGEKVYSQPIKGTAPRGKDTLTDQQNINALQQDPKERSENIMIVDLVRNDLSKIAKKNTVEVSELCRVYTFETVHQMISTVEAVCRPELSELDLLTACFPMGSMTGAPKVRVMEWVEKLESTKRGLYAGSFGYIGPNGDFDFNVVIRTLQYNQDLKYLSGMVGGAITILSDPEKEWEETQLKAESLLKAVEACIPSNNN